MISPGFWKRLLGRSFRSRSLGPVHNRRLRSHVLTSGQPSARRHDPRGRASVSCSGNASASPGTDGGNGQPRAGKQPEQ